MGSTLPGWDNQYKILKIVVLAIFCGIGSLYLLSDDDAARVYLKKAKELTQKRDFLAARENFQKAMEESPDLPEVHFERGVMYWQARELGDAMKDFNRAEDLIKLQTKPAKSIEEIQRKITVYQSDYRKLTDEYSTLNQKYIGKFMELVQKYQDKPDDYLLEILRKLSLMEPGNKEIVTHLERAKTALFAEGKDIMTPLFNNKNLDGWESADESWKVEKGEIVGSLQSGAKVIRYASSLENNYTPSANIKLDEIFEANYFTGVVFAFTRGENFYVFGPFKNRLVLMKSWSDKSGEVKHQFLSDKIFPESVKTTEWNNFLVRINETAIFCYLNNELQFEVKEPEEKKPRFKGSPGMLIQSCTVRFKNILSLSE